MTMKIYKILKLISALLAEFIADKIQSLVWSLEKYVDRASGYDK